MPDHLGCLIADIAGTTLTSEDKHVIDHPLVGGIILFARNYESPEQLRALTNAIRGASRQPLLIMVDQEGGRVQRFIDGFTRLAPLGELGVVYDDNPAQGLQLAYEHGQTMANEVLAGGIDLSIAPVLDLNKVANQAVGNRAFHQASTAVIALAGAYIKGMHTAGMASTGKHFPGHGSVALDSHVGTPVDERTFADIQQDDLVPFAHLIKMGIRAMLASHILYPNVDNKLAGFSSFWLRDVLRQQLKFTGPILTDDLNMEGANISANYADRVLAAREAGCDFALVCNNRAGVLQVIDQVSPERHLVTPEKWQLLCGDFSKLTEPNL